MYVLVRRGPDHYPGAKYVIRESGERINLKFRTSRDDLTLHFGDKVGYDYYSVSRSLISNSIMDLSLIVKKK